MNESEHVLYEVTNVFFLLGLWDEGDDSTLYQNLVGYWEYGKWTKL